MDDIDKWCYGCLQVINEVEDVLTENRIWRLRTKDIGTVSAEDAINLGFRLITDLIISDYAKPLPSARQCLSYGNCLDVKTERNIIRTAVCWIV